MTNLIPCRVVTTEPGRRCFLDGSLFAVPGMAPTVVLNITAPGLLASFILEPDGATDLTGQLIEAISRVHSREGGL